MAGMQAEDVSLAPGSGPSAALAGQVQGRGREGSQELRCKPRSSNGMLVSSPIPGQHLGSDSCPVREAEEAKAPIAKCTPGVGIQPLFSK